MRQYLDAINSILQKIDIEITIINIITNYSQFVFKDEPF